MSKTPRVLLLLLLVLSFLSLTALSISAINIAKSFKVDKLKLEHVLETKAEFEQKVQTYFDNIENNSLYFVKHNLVVQVRFVSLTMNREFIETQFRQFINIEGFIEEMEIIYGDIFRGVTILKINDESDLSEITEKEMKVLFRPRVGE